MPNLVLADTSIWVTHFRKSENHLIQLLELGFVACHPFIIGELACGSIKNRHEIIQLLEALPNVPVLEHQEVMSFIESRKIMSKGIGYVDTHLLGSSILAGIPIWTLDKSLAKVSSTLEIEYIKAKR
jgi:predicted nucleic acid-binding protein